MGSLNSPGIPVVNKQNTSMRSEGGALVSTSGLFPQTGPTSQKINTINDPQGHDRSAVSFGTQPDKAVVQYSTLNLGGTQKVTTSEDGSLVGGDIKSTTGGPAPTATSQPEIANIVVSQRSVYHTGGKVVVNDSGSDITVARQSNDSTRPGP